MKKKIKQFMMLLILMVCITPILKAQELSIKGKVTDSQSGDPLPGVNIVVKGTTIGTATNANGKYTLSVPQSADSLVYSYIGYARKVIAINGRSVINMKLQPASIQSKGVVVTAFGIKRNSRNLGYSVQTVSGNKLSKVPSSNLGADLEGKVAGVQISTTSSGVAGASRVVIRGNSSISGNNQPLYVVDGVPINDNTYNAASQWGGYDFGDGLNGLNPQNIQSISVLTGASATALYGSSAANGVVLITTKKGRHNKRIGVTFNSNVQFNTPAIYPKFQNTYGHGSEGKVPTTLSNVIANGAGSWGPKMQGQQVLFWNGKTRAMTPQPNNVKNFYRTGSDLNNNIALSGGTKNSTYRLDISQENNQGITPATSFKVNNFNLRVTSKLSDHLSADAKVNYIKTEGKNRPELSDNPGNPALDWSAMPRDIVTSNLLPVTDSQGKARDFSNDIFRINPYWGLYKNTETDYKDRLIGYAKLTYNFTPWLSIFGRAGTDYYTFNINQLQATNTPYYLPGSLNKQDIVQRDNNYDLILTADHKLGANFSNHLILGLHRENQSTTTMQWYASNFAIPNFNDVSNAATKAPSDSKIQKVINSAFGSYQIGYKDFAFLEVTGRNDWSSTLPLKNDSYFYPSVSGSFIFTDALHIKSKILNFGKIRASWAEVGNDTQPYMLGVQYALNGSSQAGQLLGNMTTGTIPPTDLKPERKKSIEFGADLDFFQNRIGLKMTYYKNNTTNQILQTSIDPSTGFGSAMVNAGNIQNKGFDATLQLTPIIQTGNFNWDMTVNFNKNVNKVISLYPGITQYTIAPTRAFATIVARPGETYGDIIGYGYKRDPQGQIIFDSQGYPEASSKLENLGHYPASWTGGITNDFSYKQFTLSALISISQGGSIYSLTQDEMNLFGTSVQSLKGRAAWYKHSGGYVGNGVVNEGSASNPKYVKNTKATDPQQYWNAMFNRGIVEPFIYSASYIKLQEVSLTYTLPHRFISALQPLSISGASISLVGRNLLFLENHLPNADPSAYAYNNGNGQGFSYGALPSTRTYGFDVNIKF
ncbi:MAG TPA: SusC/RagA family TonB-linked outer membrane protein [Balneolales bacterium]|nr:SusC/RagA family TonB-linked outer membrane protein [Balneolales bacterium]